MIQLLADFDPKPLTRQQLATLSDFTVSGGTFGTYLSTLRRMGAIAEEQERVTLTDAGRSYAREKLRNAQKVTRSNVVERWHRCLRAGEREMLDAVLRDGELERGELARAVGMEPTGGTFGTYLSTLRRNDLVSIAGTIVRAGGALKAWGVAR